jgi:hypothetical protein
LKCVVGRAAATIVPFDVPPAPCALLSSGRGLELVRPVTWSDAVGGATRVPVLRQESFWSECVAPEVCRDPTPPAISTAKGVWPTRASCRWRDMHAGRSTELVHLDAMALRETRNVDCSPCPR